MSVERRRELWLRLGGAAEVIGGVLLGMIPQWWPLGAVVMIAGVVPLVLWFLKGRRSGLADELPTNLPKAKLSDWQNNAVLPLGSWACLIEGLHPPLKGTDIGATQAYPIHKMMKTAINKERTLKAVDSDKPTFKGADRNTDVHRDELRRYFEEHHQNTRWRYPKILFPERTPSERADDKRRRREAARGT